ncbi:IS66 family insertion sequence element accessory protein TnpA [Cupriavidus necator]
MREIGGEVASKEVEWRRRLVKFVASGQQVKEFCRIEQVSPATFYRWRRQLDAIDGSEAPATGFIDIGTVPLARAAQAAQCADTGETALEVRLDLGHGLVLQILRR